MRPRALLDPMDLMLIFSGAGSDKVLLEQLATFIESKRKRLPERQPS